MWLINITMPIFLSQNIPIATEPNINIGPELLQNAVILLASALDIVP